MIHNGYISIVLLSVGCGLVTGSSSGAPTGACAELAPAVASHGSPSTDPSPYSVATASNTYNMDAITITVTAMNTMLKGVLCQVRKTDDTAVGTFSVSDATNYQVKECSNPMDSVTHRNGDNKGESATFTWTPPEGDMGNLKAVCTFVESNPGNYWLRVEAPMMLTYDGTGSNGTAMSDENAANSSIGYVSLTFVLAVCACIIRNV